MVTVLVWYFLTTRDEILLGTSLQSVLRKDGVTRERTFAINPKAIIGAFFNLKCREDERAAVPRFERKSIQVEVFSMAFCLTSRCKDGGVVPIFAERYHDICGSGVMLAVSMYISLVIGTLCHGSLLEVS